MNAIISKSRRVRDAAAKTDNNLRVLLAKEIRDEIERQEITQTVAAEIMHDSPSQVSLVCSLKVRGFSVTRLLRMLARLGKDITIAITATWDRKPGKVRVER